MEGWMGWMGCCWRSRPVGYGRSNRNHRARNACAGVIESVDRVGEIWKSNQLNRSTARSKCGGPYFIVSRFDILRHTQAVAAAALAAEPRAPPMRRKPRPLTLARRWVKMRASGKGLGFRWAARIWVCRPSVWSLPRPRFDGWAAAKACDARGMGAVARSSAMRIRRPPSTRQGSPSPPSFRYAGPHRHAVDRGAASTGSTRAGRSATQDLGCSGEGHGGVERAVRPGRF